ncbi:MAG: T9SS type A sorting domain-containing protein [Bacteroidia bacterium]
MRNTYFCTSASSGNQVSKALSRIRIGLLTFVLVVFGLSLNAQVSTYAFTSSAGTYTPITGGTVLGTASNDDNIFSNLPIGFSFCYNGVQYTEFGANANGWIYMGNSVAITSYTSLSSGSQNNVISAFNFDIQSEAVIGEMRYQLIGTAPNRTLVVQWQNYDAYQSINNSDVYNFQIRLSETTNQVNIVYGNFTCASGIRNAQVGIRGNSNADFNNISIINGSQTWATPISGASNTATAEINNSPLLIPASGQTYTFSQPSAPAAPISLVFSAVTSSAMTLTWNDNSTNEANFSVYRSTDNITFVPVNTQASSSVATTGSPYTYTATGLFSNQIYYWRVFAGNANCGGTPLTGNQTTLSGTMCGTYTIGPSGAYTSLTAAVAAVATNGVACPLIFEFQAAYVSTVETFPIVIPFLGNGPTGTITARPELGATNLSITSTSAQTIDFSGTSYFTFDGRPGGVGTIRQLTIENTSVTGNAVRFINGSINCGFNYCKIRGVMTSSTNGVVLFSTSSATNGNSNNSITNCDLFDNTTQPSNLIYASNGSALLNTANVISNNTFHDWFSATAQSSAISVTTGNSAWTISNNSFYQTAVRTYTTGNTHYGIFVNSTTTNTGAYIITGNYVGGSSALCGGTAFTQTGTIATRFVAINITTTAGGTSSVQGNTIKNFNLTTSSGTTTANGIWCGINITGTGANVSVGNITPNIIGSNTVNGQIATSTSTTGGMTVGINSSASGNVDIINNQIGGITTSSSTTTISSSIFGIQVSAGALVNITGNIIGSTTVASSLMNSVSTGTTGGHVTGIFSSFTTTAVISGNTIMNLTNQYAGTITTGQTRGITVTSGSNTITGNTIAALANLSPQIGTGTAASVLGINCSSTSTTQSISLNTISGLANGSATGAVQVTGINYSGASTGVNSVFRNTISALASASSGVAVINGINITAGVATYYNNFINLGVDITGAPLTASHEYNGIFKSTATNNKFYYNTVSIAGSGVNTGAANSFAFRRTAIGADTLKNNIFYNNRSNGASTGIHYSISLGSSTTFISNNNIIYGNGVGYVLGLINTTPYSSISAWSGATSQDLNSYSVDPMFISATNLHINNATASPLESRGVVISGITTDYDNDVRPGPVASVNGGGTLPDIGADEFDGIPLAIDMGISALNRPSATGCHTASDSVTFVLKNFSAQTIDFTLNPVTINSAVTGPNPMSFAPVVINTGTLAGNATMNVTVSTTYNMSAAGVYGFTANTTTTGDVISSNDALSSVNINVSGGTVLSSVSSICASGSATLTASGYTAGGSIQWQDSPDNITFTNIAAATNPTLSVTPSSTRFYRTVICGVHNSTSDTVTVIVVTSPTTVSGTRCGTGPVSLSASGSGTLNWFDAPTAGNQVNSGTTYTPTVAATTTYYVEATSGTPPSTHTTTFAAGNGSSGNMFGITAINTVTITSFDGHVAGPGTNNWSIYYRPDNYLLVPGANTSSTGWILLGSAANVPALGTGVPTPIPVTFAVTIPAGQTYSFHVVSTLGGTVSYTNGTTVGNVYNANTDFQFREGHGGTLFSCTNVPRVFNGRIHYQAGCASSRVPVTATVTPAPAITAITGSSMLCNGDSASLSVSSSNSGYTYTWSPSAFLSTTTGNSTVSTPTAPGNYIYYVDGNDISTGCMIRDTVSFLVNPVPFVSASVDFSTVCAGSTVNLAAFQPPSVVQITNGNVINTSTTYPAPYGQFYGGARHQMLILASELTAAGLTSGNLTELAFEVTATNTGAPLSNFTISLGTTPLTDLSAGFATYSPTQVYTTSSYAPIVGVNSHVFATPFFWDGLSNIIVETCFANYTTPPTTSFTSNASMRQIATPFVSTAFNRYDNTANICGIASTATALQRPNIAFTQSYSTWNYAWTPTVNVATPNMQNTAATPMTTTNFTVTVTDAANGCFSTDSVLVTVNPTPAPMLGADTAICSNTVLTLDASAGPYTYLWSDASTNQTLPVNAFGNYNVLVTDSVNGCAGSDTILVGINAAPNFSLGSDAIICSGNTVTFSGPAGQYSYDWNTLDTTQAITTGNAGTYMLTLTDLVNSCFNSDTVALAVNPLPVVMLGSDITVCSANAPVTLTATAGNYTYNWSDASTSATLNVTATGSYYVIVTDPATTCYGSDTIVVTVNSSPVVNLGSDTTFCSASGLITINATAGPYNYLWSDLSSGISLTTNTTGNYDVTVTDSITGCATMDAITVTVNTSPVVNLGADTTMCGGSVQLNAGNAGANYSWSTTATTQMITVSSTGNYYVNVTTTAGCTDNDSVMVTINTVPTVTFNAQASACTTDPAFALTGSPAGGVFTGPGVSGNMFSPSTAGVGTANLMYTFTDVNGCTASDPATITVSACVGITEPFIAAGMNLFPNPNNGSFTLTINDADYKALTIELVTVEGQVIYSDKASDVTGVYVKQLDLSTHANGIYFLRVTANGQTYMQKVVKQD